ncbi:MAG TPA: hypothetical protein VGI10_30560 [Polyangiaceae bacterium]|jgi:hypothetical protein
MTDDTASELPEWTDEERLLLASADLDQAPAHSLERSLQAAAAATAVASGIAASQAAASTLAGKATGAFALVKWLGFVTLVGAAGIGGNAWRKSHASAAAVASAAHVRGALPPELPVTAMPASASSVAAEAAADPTATATADSSAAPDSSGAPASTPRSASARSAPSAHSQPDLARDIAALDQVRQALRAGRSNDALAALARYDAEFGKSGALRVEANVLRIEATARAGDRARAQTLARAFLAQNPQSPYAARVRKILQE